MFWAENNFNVWYQVYIRQMGWLQLPWDMFLRPFSAELWVTVLCTMVFTATQLTLVQCLGRHFGNAEQTTPIHYSLYESLFIVFSAFCQQGQSETPRATSCRIVFAVVYFTAVILLASYSAILISFLTIQKERLPFTDLQGLMDDGSYKFGVLANSTEYHFFRNTSDAVMRELYKQYMEPDDNNFPQTDMKAFNRVCNMKFAYMIPFEYMLQIHSQIPCSIIALPTKYFHLSLSIALAKKSPYRGLINHKLQIMRRGGLLQKLYDITWPAPKSHESISWVSVRVYHLVPLLLVLIIGILLGISLLGIEYVHNSIRPVTSTQTVKKPSTPASRYAVGNSETFLSTGKDSTRLKYLHDTQYNKS